MQSCDQEARLSQKPRDDSHGNRGSYPRVRAGKGSRSNVEQAVGQGREVQAKEPDEDEASRTFHIAQAAREVPSRVQMEFCWMSVQGSSWLRSHLLLMHRFFQLASIVQVFYVLNALSSLIKLFCQKVSPFAENARSKLKDRFFF